MLGFRLSMFPISNYGWTDCIVTKPNQNQSKVSRSRYVICIQVLCPVLEMNWQFPRRFPLPVEVARRRSPIPIPTISLISNRLVSKERKRSYGVLSICSFLLIPNKSNQSCCCCCLGPWSYVLYPKNMLYFGIPL